jgi:hypothetical protein
MSPRGAGFSVDRVTLTNGFHPLWAVLSSLAFMVGGGSDELAIRIVLFASAVTTIASAFLWAPLFSRLFGVDNRLYRVCFVLLYLTAFQLVAQHFNGLETGLLLALLAATGLYWSSTTPSFKRSAILGVLLGVLILVRIDSGKLVVAMALEALWRARDVFLTADRYGYFPPDSDPRRYYRQSRHLVPPDATNGLRCDACRTRGAERTVSLL